jgi:DNA-binding CsgD family transcriptional regulator
MCLTERERQILQLVDDGLSAYKIARQLGCDPPNINRAKKNGLKKLETAINDLEWAKANCPKLLRTEGNNP